jgi:hypothetical protein
VHRGCDYDRARARDLGLGPRSGTFVIDRFLFTSHHCSCSPSSARWSTRAGRAGRCWCRPPRRWGFARHLQRDFLWSGQFPLSTDSPIALPYKWFADLGGGKSGASAILVCLTLGSTIAFVIAARFVRPALLTAVLAVALAVLLPADTTYAFAKLFSRDGHAVRPLTRSEAGYSTGSIAWSAPTRRSLPCRTPSARPSRHAQVLARLEFWNKSVRYGVHYPPGLYADAVIWFPNNALTFDPRSGSGEPLAVAVRRSEPSARRASASRAPSVSRRPT